MSNSTAILKDAIVENHPNGTVLDIFESDRVLYSRCEFRGVTVIFREGAKKAFRDCLFKNCDIKTPRGIHSYWLAGANICLNCTINGKAIEDLRTN